MDRWEKTKELFERAQRVPTADREAFLRAECPDDPELAEEVRSLLEHHSEEFLEDPQHIRRPGNRDETPAELPATIGPYKILEELGSGGMGVVYLAEQQRPVQRKVALKVIHQGMLTKQVLARFDTERQALALMSHANIARVYDAGATEAGSPYFVMEYVAGVPIIEHCNRYRLGSRQRLELFAEVCDGMQHAHQKGIIHRDIKSSNVLVAIEGDDAVAKIIDFGIAKAIDRRLTEATAHTEIGQIVGTPEFMSPEQAEMTGQDIDTRTDIYSLGVLLYVLLVGEYPFDSDELRRVSFDELRRKIREDDPPRPSTRFSSLGERREVISRERKTDPGSFARELRGDLDWIVMKALDKDRTRRYASAAELAADVRRHLADEPVTARPPGAAYRVGKFVRRHRFGVAAATVVLIALIVGVIGTTIGMVRARAAQRANEELVQYLFEVFSTSDPERGPPGNMTAAEILEAGKERIEGLDDQPRFQARLAREIGRIYRTQGDHQAALPLLRQSLEINRRILDDDDEELLKSINQLANFEADSHNDEEAFALYQEALVMAERIYGPEHEDLAVVLKNLGDRYTRTKDYETARQLHERALAIREKAGSPKVAQSLASLGDILVRSGDYEEAIPLLQRSLETRRTTLPEGHYRIGLGHYFLARALDKAGRLDEATVEYGIAFRILDNALDPTNEKISNAAFYLADALNRQGHHDKAEPFYARTLAIDEVNHGSDHQRLIPTLEGYASCLRGLDRADEADELAARASRIRETAQAKGAS